MSPLTEEQKRRMEENRRKALARRQENSNQNKALGIRPSDTSKNTETKRHIPNNVIKPSLQTNFLTNFKNNNSNGSFVSKGHQSAASFSNTFSTKVSTSNGDFTKSALRYTKTNNINDGVTASNFYGTKVTGTFCLISKDKFLADVGFHTQMINIFKLMETRQYDSSTRKWSFAISEHNKLVNELKSLRPEVCISPLPDYVIKILKDGNEVSQQGPVDLSSIDPQLLEAFFPFQHEGVCCGIRRRGRVLIADDMGLGKTIQALGIASYYRQEWPLLIVCPASVRYAWADAISKWMPSVNTSEIAVLDTAKDDIEYCEVIICSYDLISKKSQQFKDRNFKVIILDESHMIKGFKTARFKAIDPLLKTSTRVIMLSGTPALSRPSELYTQITGLKKLFPSFQTYGIRYCDGKQTNWGWNFTGSSNMEELQIILTSSVMIRRLKCDVITQLPSKQRMVTILDPSLIKVGFKNLQDAAQKFDNKGLKGIDKHGALLQFFAETAKAKLKAVSDYVLDLLEAEKKFLIFAHHKIMLDNICETCEKGKTKYIRIDGATSADARNKLVERFQVCDDIKVAVLSITAANSGITLTAAHLVLFAELYWNPGVLAQAEDRAHRIGQRDCVTVQYLLAKGTSDDHIWNLVREKLEVLNKAGLTKDNFNASNQIYHRSKEQQSLLKYFCASETNKENDTVTCDVTDEDLHNLTDDIDFSEEISWPKKMKCSKEEEDNLNDFDFDDELVFTQEVSYKKVQS